jgi:hypothetical protein
MFCLIKFRSLAFLFVGLLKNMEMGIFCFLDFGYGFFVFNRMLLLYLFCLCHIGNLFA